MSISLIIVSSYLYFCYPFLVKLTLSIVAIALTFIGYAPYITDIFRGKTKPHIFTWGIWGMVTAIIFSLQWSAGAGPGSLVTLCVAMLSLFIFVKGYKNGIKIVKPIDVVFLVLALVATALWLFAKQPVLSAILLSTIDMLAFAPTIRKAWNAPYSETLSLYVITTFRHVLSFMALDSYSIVTWLFPVTWVFANALFSVILIVRRSLLKK